MLPLTGYADRWSAAPGGTYCGSLCHNGYDNNVARITGNVLRRLLGKSG